MPMPPQSRTTRVHARTFARGPRRARGRGQSLAEFALTVPMALLMVLFGLDFGRVFLGWVALTNAAREAANYAAMNPTAWSVPYDLVLQAEYERLVETEASNINCALASPIPAPVFGSGTGLGAPALVELSCQFSLVTPFIGLLVGNPIPVSASAAFPVRSGLIESVPIETASPSPGASSSTSPSATPGPSATAAPSTSPTASPSPTATPEPTATPLPSGSCKVISLINVNTNKAASDWLDAGFSGQVIFVPLVPPTYRIAWQSLTVGTVVDCTSGITARSRAP